MPASTTTPLLLTLLAAAALTTAQSTTLITGEPPVKPLPTIALNAEESAVLNKYTSALNAFATAPPAALVDYYNTATEIPAGLAKLGQSALQGHPVPTNALTALPSSIRDIQLSLYDNVASVAADALSADPTLASFAAAVFDGAADASNAPVETLVLSSGKVVSREGGVKTTLATKTTAAGSQAAGTSSATGPDTTSAAVSSGVAGASGTGAPSGSGVGSATASGSPIASVKPNGAAVTGRVGWGVGALVAVAAGVVGFL